MHQSKDFVEPRAWLPAPASPVQICNAPSGLLVSYHSTFHPPNQRRPAGRHASQRGADRDDVDHAAAAVPHGRPPQGGREPRASARRPVDTHVHEGGAERVHVLTVHGLSVCHHRQEASRVCDPPSFPWMLRARGGGCSSSKAKDAVNEPAEIPANNGGPPTKILKRVNNDDEPRDRNFTRETVATLDMLEAELTQMQTQSTASAAAIAAATHGRGVLPLGLRSQLASLHGSANKLLATRLDAVATSDLSPGGRDQARAQRKRLVQAAGTHGIDTSPCVARPSLCPSLDLHAARFPPALPQST